MRAPVLLAIGLIVGVFGGWLAGRQSNPPEATAAVTPPAEPGKRPNRSSRPPATKGPSREGYESPQIARASHGVGEPGDILIPAATSGPAPAPALATLAPGAEEDPLLQAMQLEQEQQVEERLAHLRFQFQLSSEQEEEIHSLLTSAVTAGDTYAEGVPPSVESQIGSVLDSGQQARYAGLLQEQRTKAAGKALQNEVDYLQVNTALSPEQARRVSAALGEIWSEEATRTRAELRDPERVEERIEARLKALRGILNAAQMQACETNRYFLIGGG